MNAGSHIILILPAGPKAGEAFPDLCGHTLGHGRHCTTSEISQVMFSTYSLSQVLIVLDRLARLELVQHLQAAEPSAFRHSPVLVLKPWIASLHSASAVLLLSGKFGESQLLLISSSHIPSTVVRFAIWMDPWLVSPLHLMSVALPPPLETSCLTWAPKTPFFPDFDPKFRNQF